MTSLSLDSSLGTGGRRPVNASEFPAAGPGALALLIERQATEYAARRFLAHARAGHHVTFEGLAMWSARWRAALEDLGIPEWVPVGVAVADPLDLCSVFLGCLGAGRWVAPVDPSLPKDAAQALLRRAGAEVVVSDAASSPLWDTESKAVALCPGGSAGSGPHQHLTVAPLPTTGSLTASGDSGQLPDGRVFVPGAGGGVVLSSSGSTGTPKLVALETERLLCTAQGVAKHHQLGPTDRCFNPLPLFHINAQVVAALASLVAGAGVVLDDRFHRQGFWELMAEHQVSWINAVPAIVARLGVLKDHEVVPPGIRFVRSASAPLAVTTLARFEEATGIPILETYGMTEAASQITANPLGEGRRPGTVGLPVGVELRVVAHGCQASVGSHPRCVPAGVVGQVEIRGPSVIAGYASAEHNARIDVGGWLATGDLGFLDEEGYLTLVGRTDDVINRSGEKVYAAEVEDAILGEAAVTSVAVVAQPDEVFGQVPVAYLTLERVDEGATSVLERIAERLERNLVRAKRPVALHLVSALPSGPTGKVQRRRVPSECPRPLQSLVVM